MDRILWKEANIKVRSYIYLSLGNEGQRSLCQHYPDLKIMETTTKDFWTRLQHLFIKDRKVTFDRYEAFTRKQTKTETLEEFHCALTDIVVQGNFICPNCNDKGLETEIKRDTCILQILYTIICLSNCKRCEIRKIDKIGGSRLRISSSYTNVRFIYN